MWLLYEILLMVGLVCYLPKAFWRRRLPHPGWSMRLGRYPSTVHERLQGRATIWVHAVSVGEVLAARPIVRALHQQHPTDQLVLSTVTASGFDVASAQFREIAVPIYFPLDLRRCVRRALDVVHPRLLILVESEWWPVMVHMAKARHIPIAVVNGRISSRAFGRYLWVKPYLKPMLSRIDLFLMQSHVDADRVIQLGAPAERVHVVGSLKWDASLSARPAAAVIQDAATRLGLRNGEMVIVAGSTHRGEETLLLQAFQTIRQAYPSARLLLAPRHLERLGEVEGLVRHAGLAPTRVSRITASQSWVVGILDTFGELATYYALAHVAYIGGSLIPHGGQNPLEAASLGKPIVFGPSMQNFEVIAHELLAHHAARQVMSGEELRATLHELLDHPEQTQAMGQRAKELTEQFQGATQRTLDTLNPLLS